MKSWLRFALCSLVASSSSVACGGRSPLSAGELAEMEVEDAPPLTPTGSVAGSPPVGGMPQATPVTSGAGGAAMPMPGAGGAGGAADSGPLSSLDYYIDPVNGRDTDPGTELLPFKTVRHAASLAIDGDTIWFKDGLYDWQTEPAFALDETIEFADGVRLRALEAGHVSLFSKVDNFGDGGFAFAGDAELYGLHFIGFNPALRADHGELLLDSVSFESPWDERICAGGENALVMLSGSAKMTMLLGEIGLLPNSSGKCVARLDDDATLSVRGGEVLGAEWDAGQDSVAIFSSFGRSKLDIEDVRMRGNGLSAIGAWDSSEVRIKQTSMEGGAFFADRAPALMHIGDDAALTVESSWFEGADLQPCLASVVVFGRERPAGKVTLKDVAMSHCARAIALSADSVVQLENVSLSDNQGGLSILSGQDSGSLDVRDSRIADNELHGIEIEPGSSSFIFSMRNSSVTRNGGDGIRLGRTPADGGVVYLDLGVAARPGRNLLRENGRSVVGSVNLRIMDDVAIQLLAVGNVWDASTQGSESGGMYSVNSLDLTTYDAEHQLLGTNYSFDGVLAEVVSLRLAER